jgi:hypothetical protein
LRSLDWQIALGLLELHLIWQELVIVKLLIQVACVVEVLYLCHIKLVTIAISVLRILFLAAESTRLVNVLKLMVFILNSTLDCLLLDSLGHYV